MRKLAAGAIAVCFILGALYYQPAHAATTRYVAVWGDDAAGNNPCADPLDPCKTITQAIYRSQDGDTIQVAAGYYNESLSINESLSLRGAGADVTTIGSGQTKIDVSGSSTKIITVNISGFTIMLADLYGIAFTYASGTIENNIIKDHELHGIRLYGCEDVRIIGNLITHNGWINNRGGSGIYISESSPVIQNNVIEGNHDAGISISSGEPIITNNTIVRNGSVSTIAFGNRSLKSNGGSNGDGIVINALGAKITNNIVAFNTGYGIYAADPDVVLDITYNDIYGNVLSDYGSMPPPPTANANISADPLFMGMGDYHIPCFSPAANMGTNFPPGGLPPKDKDGHPRIIGGRVDMGAYETICIPTQTPPISISNPVIPIAQNHINQGTKTVKEANDLLSQAESKGLDTAACEALIDEAKELLDKAKKSLTNPIYANNLALKAMEKMREAIDCLKALLG